jgi:hypothetical protein
MIPRISYKRILSIIFALFIISSILGIMVSSLYRPYDLYVRIIDITWPPPSHLIVQSDDDVLYGVPMEVEVWNPSKKTINYSTPNLNLVDPHMEILLEDDLPWRVAYISWIMLTHHEIKPGITIRNTGIDIIIDDYTSNIPPAGKYTAWVGIDGEPELHGTPPFNFQSYKVVINHNYVSNEIKFKHTPKKWGKIYPMYRKLNLILIWGLTGGELIAFIYFYRKKLKIKNLNMN